MGRTRRARLADRWRAARTKLRGRSSSAAGAAAAAAGFSLRALPGVAGPLLVAYGSWLAWAPLGYLVLGGFLLWADRRMP